MVASPQTEENLKKIFSGLVKGSKKLKNPGVLLLHIKTQIEQMNKLEQMGQDDVLLTDPDFTIYPSPTLARSQMSKRTQSALKYQQDSRNHLMKSQLVLQDPQTRFYQMQQMPPDFFGAMRSQTPMDAQSNVNHGKHLHHRSHSRMGKSGAAASSQHFFRVSAPSRNFKDGFVPTHLLNTGG